MTPEEDLDISISIADELLIEYGGRYSGLILQAVRYSDSGLRSANNNFAARIAEHESKLSAAMRNRNINLANYYRKELQMCHESRDIIRHCMERKGE